MLWVVPELSGGIRTYADALASPVRSECARVGLEMLESTESLSIEALARLNPDLIHVQHEYGLFGSKVPGRYFFPRWIAGIRRRMPRTRFVATAHTVLGRDYSYPWGRRGWQIPLRIAANLFLLPWARRQWIARTWGLLDGVIVHSDLQKDIPIEAGCPCVRVIPHFVPEGSESGEGEDVVVFGYFSPEKGQDIAIEAWKALGPCAPRLVLAGGARRKEDLAYLERCRARIRALGLESRVEITGFVPFEQLDAIYRRARLVLAPFRETSGSGSLAQALARGQAILASDLPLNREIERRQPGALALFRSEDPSDCAARIRELWDAPGVRGSLRFAARSYASTFSISATAAAHASFYREILAAGDSR